MRVWLCFKFIIHIYLLLLSNCYILAESKKVKMQTEFDINIKDNFIEPKIFKSIYDKIPFYQYSDTSHKYTHDTTGEITTAPFGNERHIWFGTSAEPEIADYIRKRCEKLYNKKLELRYCSYTLVLPREKPMVHCDARDTCTHQIIVYIRGDRGLHRGTGFYTEVNNKYELNTHIGFNENRAIFWYSPVFHSPLTWCDENKSKRYSIIAQYKEIK